MNRTILLATSVFVLSSVAYAQSAVNVRVAAEEDVYTYEPPDNGSGPLWSFGCTTIARSGDEVIISEQETGEGVPRLCNTRWRLRKRTSDGAWPVVAEAEGYHQREPCVLAVTGDGNLFLNVNTSSMPAGTEYGPCEPHLLRFQVGSASWEGEKLAPAWTGEPYFTDHSYRGYAADSGRDELLMLNIDAKTSVQNWSWLTAAGKTRNHGQITFPIRSCYPQVALKDGAGYVLAVSDIVEPVEAWRSYKFEQTQRTWDYVFRILYFTATPDLAKTPFGEPVEIANVDATGGHISNQDLWIAPDGTAYIMYLERAVASEMMRDKYFPELSVLNTLHLALVKDGVVQSRRVLFEGTDARQAGWARFQETPDGSLYAVLSVSGEDGGDKLMRISPEDAGNTLTPIPLEKPMSAFLLATVRAGNAPSNIIDMHGPTADTAMGYAQVIIE